MNMTDTYRAERDALLKQQAKAARSTTASIKKLSTALRRLNAAHEREIKALRRQHAIAIKPIEKAIRTEQHHFSRRDKAIEKRLAILTQRLAS